LGGETHRGCGVIFVVAGTALNILGPNVIFAKDFIETAEGLIFAVVANGTENSKVLCFLRFVKGAAGWKKVATGPANAFLLQHHPEYLHYSPILAAHLHAVALDRVIKHHQPKQRLQHIMQTSQQDIVERDVFQLCQLLQQQGLDLTLMGVTGSILVGVQKQSSDIDLVCYGRAVFHHCRAITRELVAQGLLQALGSEDWLASYQRRSCALSYADYVWHERRKGNKAIINGRKFDLNFIADGYREETTVYQKQGAATVQCRVVDDTYGFDYPAKFILDHEQFNAVVSFTATYTGQALKGERVEIAGAIEQNEQGGKRLVVGSSREAQGEYIRVIRA
jgi:predicted nucleotidyltransferase